MADRRKQNSSLPAGIERRSGERRRDIPLLTGVVEKAMRELEAERAKNEALQLEKEKAEQETLVDSLTGLGNRKALIQTLEQLIIISAANGVPLAIGVGDNDDQKYVNDKVSWDAGDELIKATGEGFVAASRDTDLVCRLGGDEFAVLLPGFAPNPDIQPKVTQEEVIDDNEERYSSSIEEKANGIGLPIRVGATYKVSMHQTGETAEEFVKRAVAVMKEAKEEKHTLAEQQGSDRRVGDRRLR